MPLEVYLGKNIIKIIKTQDNQQFPYTEPRNWLNQGRLKLIRILMNKNLSSKSIEILEIGAGIGGNLPVFYDFGSVDVNEISSNGKKALNERKGLGQIFDKPVPFSLEKKYDLIAAIEVIEHIEDDHIVIQWIFDHLKPGGIFLATIPAFQFLYSDHDVALNHFRRYNRKTFQNILPNQFEVLDLAYFNVILFPLAVFSRIFRKLIKVFFRGGKFSGKQSSKLPRLVGNSFKMIMFAEALLISKGVKFPFGVTLYCVAKKTV